RRQLPRCLRRPRPAATPPWPRWPPHSRRVARPHSPAPPLNGGADSQCTWTLDNVPVYRVIEVDVSAFSPSGLASGDGSATFAAIHAYAQDQAVLEKPAAQSGQPPATNRDIPGPRTAPLAD